MAMKPLRILLAVLIAALLLPTTALAAAVSAGDTADEVLAFCVASFDRRVE